MAKAQKDISKKLRVFEYAKAVGNVAKTCRHFGISLDTYYRWQGNYQIHGEDGLIDSKPCPQNVPLRTSSGVEDKIVYLRRVIVSASSVFSGTWNVIMRSRYHPAESIVCSSATASTGCWRIQGKEW